MPNVLIEGNLNVDFAQKAVQFFCKHLGISVPNLHIFTDETIRVNGACYQNNDDDYMIVLREQDYGQMIVTLAHELTHVKQYIQDQLGVHFDSDIPYLDRWWEKEAIQNEVELMMLLIEAVEKGEI